jgi:hypothetical protein
MALPPNQHNSETMRGEIAYRRERLMKRAPSLLTTFGAIFIVPPLAAYWLVQWLYKRATGRSLPDAVIGASADGDQSAICAGSRRASSGGSLARCSQCGKYVALNNGRLLVHSR